MYFLAAQAQQLPTNTLRDQCAIGKTHDQSHPIVKKSVLTYVWNKTHRVRLRYDCSIPICIITTVMLCSSWKVYGKARNVTGTARHDYKWHGMFWLATTRIHISFVKLMTEQPMQPYAFRIRTQELRVDMWLWSECDMYANTASSVDCTISSYNLHISFIFVAPAGGKGVLHIWDRKLPHMAWFRMILDMRHILFRICVPCMKVALLNGADVINSTTLYSGSWWDGTRVFYRCSTTQLSTHGQRQQLPNIWGRSVQDVLRISTQIINFIRTSYAITETQRTYKMF